MGYHSLFKREVDCFKLSSNISNVQSYNITLEYEDSPNAVQSRELYIRLLELFTFEGEYVLDLYGNIGIAEASILYKRNLITVTNNTTVKQYIKNKTKKYYRREST